MLNPRNAAGHDGITTNELRLLADDMGVCLANICRQGYLERRFPSTWKIGKLKPAYKVGERVERGHYRPLTMLPIASRVYEAVICNQLDEQVDLTKEINGHTKKEHQRSPCCFIYQKCGKMR